MASRLLARLKTLRYLHSLTSVARSRPSDSSSTVSASRAISSILGSAKEIIKATIGTDSHSNKKEVICFNPLEASSTKTRSGGLVNESLKIQRLELSQEITYALIPALILISKSSLTTSLLIFSVYWQIYGYFKEISRDYVHQDLGFGVFRGAAFGQGYYSRLWFGVISL